MFSQPDPAPQNFVPPVPWPGKFEGVSYAPRLTGEPLQEFLSFLSTELHFRVQLIENKREQLIRKNIPLDEFVRLEETHSVLRHLDLMDGEENLANPFPAPWSSPYWEDEITLGGDIILAEMVQAVLERFQEQPELRFSELTLFMKERSPALNLYSLVKLRSSEDAEESNEHDYERPDSVRCFYFSNHQEAVRAGAELAEQENFERIFSYWQISGALNPRRSAEQAMIREQIWMEGHDIFIDDIDQLFEASAEQLLVNLWRFELCRDFEGQTAHYALLTVESAWDQVCAIHALQRGIIGDLDQFLDRGQRWESINFSSQAENYFDHADLVDFSHSAIEQIAQFAALCNFAVPWDTERFCKLVGIN